MSSKGKDEDEGAEDALKWWEGPRHFLMEVRQELGRVTWPERKETMVSTGVILFLVVLTVLYLGVLDWGVSHLVRLLLR